MNMVEFNSAKPYFASVYIRVSLQTKVQSDKRNLKHLTNLIVGTFQYAAIWRGRRMQKWFFETKIERRFCYQFSPFAG